MKKNENEKQILINGGKELGIVRNLLFFFILWSLVRLCIMLKKRRLFVSGDVNLFKTTQAQTYTRPYQLLLYLQIGKISTDY